MNKLGTSTARESAPTARRCAGGDLLPAGGGVDLGQLLDDHKV